MCAGQHAQCLLTAQPVLGSPQGRALPQRPPISRILWMSTVDRKQIVSFEGRYNSAKALITALALMQDTSIRLKWDSTKRISVLIWREALSHWRESRNFVRTAWGVAYSDIETPKTVKTELKRVKASGLTRMLPFIDFFRLLTNQEPWRVSLSRVTSMDDAFGFLRVFLRFKNRLTDRKATTFCFAVAHLNVAGDKIEWVSSSSVFHQRVNHPAPRKHTHQDTQIRGGVFVVGRPFRPMKGAFLVAGDCSSNGRPSPPLHPRPPHPHHDHRQVLPGTETPQRSTPLLIARVTAHICKESECTRDC